MDGLGKAEDHLGEDAEGDETGPVLSLKGLGNAQYFRLDAADPGRGRGGRLRRRGEAVPVLVGLPLPPPLVQVALAGMVMAAGRLARRED